MRFHTALKLLALTFVFAFLSAGVVRADNQYATIRGQVVDQTKATIPGAQVTATNTGTNEARTVTTQADGSFEFLSLPIGTYNVSVTKDGFQTYQATGIVLVINQIYVINPTLQVGSASQTVTVEAARTQVETTSMQLGTTVEAKTIVDMPLNGRNWVQLQQLQPGVVASSDRFGSNFATNGSQSQQNSYLINGTDANDLPLNTPLILPSPDAIQEFRMITNTINPEYGRNSGAILDAVIKSGTNQFHGDAFDFYRDTFLNTRNTFQTKAPVFHQNQYGGTIGGPIWKNHTFGFFSFQGTKNVVPQGTGNTQVFTAPQLAGTWGAGAFDTVLPATAIQPGQPGFVDPRTVSAIPEFGDPCPTSGSACAAGTPYGNLVNKAGTVLLGGGLFASGNVPTQDFSTLSSALITKFVPPATGGNCGNASFCFNPQTPGNTKQYIFQVNQNLGQHDTLWFTGFLQHNLSTDTLPFTGANLPGFGDESETHLKQFTGAWNHIFNANTLNEFRIGYTRLNFLAVNPQSAVLPASLGFNISPQDPAGAGAPLIATPFFTLGFSNNGPQPRIDQTKQITDNLSHIYGKNTLKFGAEYRDFWVTNPFFFNNNGAFGFNNQGPFSTGIGAVNFQLGIPQSYAQSSGGFIDARAKEFYGYAQDEYKLRQDLTLTFGMGYQIDTPLRDIANGGLAINCFSGGQQSSVFPTAPTGMTFPGDANCPVGGYYTHYNDWAPRVGFAWAPHLGRLSGDQGNFSIRGGFGIYYNRSEEEETLQNLLAPPFALSSSGIGDLGTGQTSAFSTPFTDVRCITQTGAAITPGTSACPATNASISNKYPFTPPAKGSAVDFSFFGPLSLNLLDPNTRVPTAMNYNLTVQREIPGQIIVSVGYVGSEARHLEGVHELNPLHNSLACAADTAGCGNANTVGIQFTAKEVTDPTNGQLCGTGKGEDGRTCFTVGQDPFYYPTADGLQFPSLAEQSTMTNSNYNSLQISAQKALSHGLTFGAAFTWSHSLDFGSSYENSSGALNLNPFDFHQMYGDSAFDARRRFVVGYDYTIPGIEHLSAFHWVPSRIGDGWHMAGITTLQSGFPITVSDSGFTSLQCNGFEFYGCWDRPDSLSAVQFENPRTKQVFPSVSGASRNYWFNPTTFAVAAAGTVGNAGRNNFHGPGINNWDLSFEKDTRVTESTSLVLRMEFYNLFNHTQFNNVASGNIESSAFGQIRAAANGRLMQLAAKFIF